MDGTALLQTHALFLLGNSVKKEKCKATQHMESQDEGNEVKDVS